MEMPKTFNILSQEIREYSLHMSFWLVYKMLKKLVFRIIKNLVLDFLVQKERLELLQKYNQYGEDV